MDVKEMLTEYIMQFGVLGIAVAFIFIFAFLIICFVFVQLLSRGRNNSRSPKLTVYASVVDKRIHYSRSINAMDSSECYVTFEVESGDRLVFNVTELEFGHLIEGDCGMLTFQGDRFCNFERRRNK